MSALICVTGSIAAGATTLARRLADIRSWNTFFEDDVETMNPFFPLYAANPKLYAFHNQVTFLTWATESQMQIRQLLRGKGVYLQDYCSYERTEVYAAVQHDFGLLSHQEYNLIQRMTKVIERLYVTPQVLVYRPLTSKKMRTRIQLRGRPSEQSLNQEYLQALSVRFEEWSSAWSRSPVVRIAEEVDVLKDDQYVHSIAETIDEYIKAHKQNYKGSARSSTRAPSWIKL